MKKRLGMLLAGACLAFGQTPNLAGVWKADLQKSKITPPPKEYLEIIAQSGPKLTELIGMVGEHGDQRTSLAFETDKPTVSYVQGIPTRLTASDDSTGLTVTGEIDGHPDDTMKRHYALSSDGQTLTISNSEKSNGHERASLIVLSRQPDEAGASLRAPQELAAKRYKNVKTALKDLPASEFIGQMHYFSWALGKDCQFCHVEHHFDSDDKEEKRTARKMIAMTLAINKDNFDEKQEVRCYTCHEFKEKAQSRPQFPGEPEHEEEQKHDDNRAGR